MKMFYRIVSGLGLLVGALLYAHAMLMGLGAAILTPLGFLFGLGEASSYATLQQQLTNLFWHVVPGWVGMSLCQLSLIVAILLVWASVRLWRYAGRRGKEPAGGV